MIGVSCCCCIAPPASTAGYWEQFVRMCQLFSAITSRFVVVSSSIAIIATFSWLAMYFKDINSTGTALLAAWSFGTVLGYSIGVGIMFILRFICKNQNSALF